MDPSYRELAQRAVELLRRSHNNRIVIAIAGVPGSGKSTLAERVAGIINDGQEIAKAVGMDGYHLTRAQLSAMDDPVTAHERRGAPFTFDAHGVVELVREMSRSAEKGETMTAPSFDHQVKDPVEQGIIIGTNIQIVLLEGLYVLLKDEPWCRIGEMVDEKWHVHVEPEVARVRVARRHLRAGITETLDLGFARADCNDASNGRYILDHSVKADVDIVSIEDAK